MHILPADLHFFWEAILKLGIAAVLGGAVGWEREISGRPAGLRTHILIVLGCTLMTMLSLRIPGSDQSRIAAQVVTGIGFLGAGSILRRGGEIKGLTTAASIWCTAAIGISVGLGGDFYAVAVVTTVLTLITLTLVDRASMMILGGKHIHEIELAVKDAESLPQVFGVLAGVGIDVSGFTRTATETGALDLILTIHAHSGEQMHTALERLSALPGVITVSRAAP